MTHDIELRRLAEAELAEASAWYDLQMPGLGDQFLQQFEENVLAIAEAPHRWPNYFQNVRRYLMSRFPYVIYYDIRSNRVRILGVVHASKDPEAIRYNLQG